MELYEKLLIRKEEENPLLLQDLTPEDLEILFIKEEKTDKMIASLFDVKTSKITSLRQKYGITLRNSSIKNLLNNDSDIIKSMNATVKSQTFTNENISNISKALTHFAFRNGPIEDMHADETKNITDEDMETLNKYMVNRVAYIFNLILEDRWIEFNFLVESTNLLYGRHWDEAVQDDGGMKELFKKEFNKYKT